MKIDRLVAIIMTLLERRRTSARQLSEMFEVSVRTIYRDVEAINAAGIPVVSSPGVGGGYHILDAYKLDKRLFTDADIVTLLIGLGSIASALDVREIANTLAKLKSFIPESRVADIELRSSQIKVDLQPWRGNGFLEKYLRDINAAIAGRKILRFSYLDRYGKASQRQVEPHRLILKDNHWYVHAFCRDKEEFRLFKLLRMDALQTDPRVFVPRSIPEDFREFTHTMQRAQFDIELVVHESILDAVLAYCPRERVEKSSRDCYTVRFPFVADDLGYGILLGFGDKCECLAPESVRREMAQRSRAIAGLYARDAFPQKPQARD